MKPGPDSGFLNLGLRSDQLAQRGTETDYDPLF